MFDSLKIENKVFAIKINELKIGLKNEKEIFKVLSSDEKKRFRKFKDKKSARRYLVGRFLIRKSISELTKIEPKRLKFKNNKFGRPFLIFPKIKKFDFNLSHSGDWVVLAIANCKVGIDIEEIHPIDLKIVKNYFHKEEIKFVYSQKGKELKNFYKIWTLKESFIKAVGRGMFYPLKSFYFKFKNGKINLYSRFEKQEWHFKVYDIYSGYKMAVCINNVEKVRLIVSN